ncbi:type VI secretion system lipoprotein TssJ, partial [Vibrio anguillarum]|nr:type VI secretion system lipoprotein TssJ [Vibrio anguillarum]MBF4327245.1 type VI secretion system lipoprotein TssJ [Vibrio anguillarum]
MNKRSFVLLMLLTVLTACSSSEKYEPATQPTKVTFSLVSDEGTIPNQL